MGTTLRRALDLLEALSREEVVAAGGSGVARLAELTATEKSQVSRTLKTLAEFGLVEHRPDTRGYRLGWHLYVLAARSGDRRLLDASLPVLRHLVRAIGERSHLSVLRGAQVLTVLSESPPHSVQTAGWVGRTVPAYCTSSGRALLCDRDRQALGELFGDEAFDRHGPNAPVDVDDLAIRVERAAAEGVAVVDEEFEAGLVGIAAPVRDAQGRVVAALSVSAPKFRLDQQLGRAVDAVRGGAVAVSAVLGWRHPDGAALVRAES
ncbi:MAG: IclR family transcriptional regulator [Egibacteraceae bacterium]